MKLTKKEKVAVKESIEHWKRMIKWVRKQKLDNDPNKITMKESIGEIWRSNDCALCEIVPRNYRDELNCEKCPLSKAGYGCDDENSPWEKVNMGSDWREWLDAAFGMIKALKSLLK